MKDIIESEKRKRGRYDLKYYLEKTKKKVISK